MPKINWHPYPLELPDSGKIYLVTVEAKEGFRYVYTAMFMYVSGWLEDKNHKVVAWAELPEPYRPSEPEDNHPDAITARKYMSGDPDTVKALHIFDE